MQLLLQALQVTQFLLAQTEEVPELVQECVAHLAADFLVAGADCFDVPLVKKHAIRECRVENAFFCQRDSVENSQQEVVSAEFARR